MKTLAEPASAGEPEGRVVRELTRVVVLKLVLIALLWWAFVRDAHVPVDAAVMAQRTQAAVSTPTTHITKESSNGH